MSKRNHLKTLLAILLILTLGFSSGSLFGGHSVVVANTPMTAVLRDAFNFRASPSASGTLIATLPSGQTVTILDMVPGSITEGYGYFWYRISTMVSGTAREGYIIRDVAVEIQDNSFANQLSAFPASYHAALTALHNAHPTWNFTALKTGYDWNTVLNAQQGKNALWYSYPISQRSIETVPENGYGPSYDLLTDTYAKKDGDYFYFASRQTIAHYLDPRNFLAEPYVFMFENLGYNTSQTIDGIEAILAGTFLSSTRTPVVNYIDTNGQTQTTGKTYAQIILDAARYSGASAYFIAARIRMEIGVNPSDSVSGTFIFTAPDGTVTNFTGYYNYFNIYASDSPIPGQNIANGLTYAKDGELNNPTNRGNFLLPWTDPVRSIMGGAYYIAQNYIRVGQDTLYLQKFSVNPSTGKFCWHQYMSSVHAPRGESASVHTSYSDMGILNNSFEFIIPVFDNMPASPVQPTTETRSTNNLLTSLSVAGGALNPVFSYSNTGTYTIYVEGAISEAAVTGRKASLTSAVSVGSTVKVQKTANVRDFSFGIPLAVGENIVPITITADNGATRVYTFKIIRGIPEELNTPDLQSLSVTGYTLNPVFSKTSTGPYSIDVPFGTASVAITATPVSYLAMVAGAGNKALAYGWNNFPIQVTSPTNVIKTYTIKVNRVVPPEKDNNILTALSADGITFDRPFSDTDTNPYTAEVRYDKATTVIRASALSEATTLTGTGAVDIAFGTHDYPVKVKSFSGAERTFVLRITRPIPVPDRGSLNLSENGILTGIQPGMTVARIKELVKAEGCETKVYRSDGILLENEALVGTGCLIRVTVGGETVSDDIAVIFGDANGDGLINAADLTVLMRSILRIRVVSGIYATGGDSNRDDRIDAADLTIIKRHILNMLTITQ